MDPLSIQQAIQDFTRFANEFHTRKDWGSVTVVFRAGVPMSIESAVSRRLVGPEQTQVAKTGGTTHGIEYRSTK
jgi:hypothetical protein